MKVMTIVGTRPELIKLSRVIPALDRHLTHCLVHTGQNYDYELNAVFFEELGIRRPDRFLDAAGATPAETIANVIRSADAALAEERPDAVLVLGDTNSCLAAIVAKRRRIPVFHMEAGNRCLDDRVPEEINRRIVDHVSDINLVYTEHARRYLLDEGLPPDRVIKTGSPMREVLEHYRAGIAASTALERLGLEPGGFFLASVHREENVDEEARLRALLQAFDELARRFESPVIVSTHPRTRERLGQAGISAASPLVRLLPPFGFFDYVHLETRARCVLSDSGTVTEESSLLGFPAVTLREVHERPEGMDEGTLVMCGTDAERILRAVEVVLAQRAGDAAPPRLVPDYEPADVSRKVVVLIVSYTGYVNQRVWHRS